ncbi:MAG: hypothetical protein JST35_06855 [Armatimonadetes bacterium]|nr:hypothetical protein [Armatimonadota bacterium]
MEHQTLGRTNRAFPPIWLSPAAPQFAPKEGWRESLIEACVELGTVIDISKGPALWGSLLSNNAAHLMTLGGHEIENAVDDSHAANLIEANLIETLSAVGRDCLDFYFLQVRRRLEEFQINGALEALESARQEGHIKHLGLCVDGPALAILGVWQFHDAFDVVLIPRNHQESTDYEALAPLARERRVGIVTSKPLNWGYGMPFVRIPVPLKVALLSQGASPEALASSVLADLAKDHPVVVAVRSAEEARTAFAAPQQPMCPAFDEMIQSYRNSWNSDEEWDLLLRDPDPIVRKAAERRKRELGR